jgi:PAS domain S-box-containing protein
VENGYTSNYQVQEKMMYLNKQISEFEKLDIRHRRTRSMTWVETEDKYLDLLEKSNKNACIIQDSKIRMITSNLASLVGYSQEEIVDSLMVHYIHIDELPKLINNYMKRMSGEDVPPLYKTVLKHKDGSKVYVEINAGMIPYRGKPADFAIIRYLARRK